MCVVACAHTHTHTHTHTGSFKPERDISSMFVICSVYSIQCFNVCFTHLFVFFLSLPLSPLFHSLLCHSLSSPLPSLSSLLTPSFLIPSPLPFYLPSHLPFPSTHSLPPSSSSLPTFHSLSSLFPFPFPSHPRPSPQ